MPLFPNSPQGSQTHFHDPFLLYYRLHLLCLSSHKSNVKQRGKKEILVRKEHVAGVQQNDGI